METAYKPYSLAHFIQQKNRELFLPHIQRPFVWDWDQVTRFLDSLMKGYPIQTFLFWKTKDAIKVRRFMDNVIEDPELSNYYDASMSAANKVKICVLDGQQRLQSLFSAFDGAFDGQDLHINILDGKGEAENGLSYRFEKSSGTLGPEYFRIRSLTTDGRPAEDISEELNSRLSSVLTETLDARFQRERQVRHNISQLVSILREDKHLWVEELDGLSANLFPYRTVLDIFIRVNSGGTKLDRADLMFAAMKEVWAEVEENIESIVEDLNNSGRISFEKDFALKCIMSASGKGATLSPELFMGQTGDKNLKDLEKIWPDANRAFTQLRDFLQNDLKLYSDKVIRSYNSFVPIFEYFFLNPSPSPIDRELMKSYYYRSQLFNWYSRGTDNIIDVLHNILRNNAQPQCKSFPLNEIKDHFQKGLGKQADITPLDMDNVRLRYIVLNLIYVERHGSSPFNVAYKGNEPHIDHIYPKSKLGRFPTQEVNHIGNYRFVGASDNIRKRAEDPGPYFDRLKASGIDISNHLLVKKYSANPNLLTFANYSDFRRERIDEIFSICAGVVNK